MPVYTDQLSRTVVLEKIPERIISLVPSQTELLYDLGLEKEVVGITKFCVHPEKWFRSKTRVGGTKNVNIETVKSLRPDLIIANKEENIREQVEQLETIAPVWLSDVNSINSALHMMECIGSITGRKEKADEIVQQVKKDISSIIKKMPPVRTAYLIWKEPYMTIGSDTFIHDILQTAGLQNLFSDKKRYPQTTLEEIRERGTELILLSSEPYPFKEKHIIEILKQLPGVQVMTTDGEMFSWYGSRLRFLAGYLHDFLPRIQANGQ